MPTKSTGKYSAIIISHPGTDFDSLASMWGAHRLKPGSPVVVIGNIDTNVREFLALYGQEFPRLRLREIDIGAVEHLTVVDCSSRTQLGRIEGLLDRDDVYVELWDHHREEGPEFRADEVHYAPVGANSTLLVRELARQGIVVSPAEATLFLLGIYEDTGSLRFPTTTPDDLDAASWLLKAGASLDVVDRFLGIRLSKAQKELLTMMSLNLQVVEVRGLPIHVTQATVEDFVDEIAFLAKKVQETENADVLFALVQLRDRVFIVGRSRLPAVDVGRILSIFGGGGHAQAASCLLSGTTHSVALQRLLDAVRELVRPTILARDIMTVEVRTVDPNTPIEEAHAIMSHTGYSGLAVTDEGNRVIGVITRSDMGKALHHGLGHAPVRGYMVRDPVTIREETSLPEIQNLIIEKRAGFLPVVFAGKLAGVVTRTDVLRALHSSALRAAAAPPAEEAAPREVGKALLSKLPDAQIDLLAVAGKLADEMGVSCYLVGGIVRDLVLDRKNVDIDVLIEGDGIEFAHRLAGHLNGRVVENPRFRTAKVVLEDEHHVDVATARQEFYIRPGALPEVAAAGIRDDLVRRDFTINTLALQLNARSWGLLVDHFGAMADIENGLVRVLHTFSFVDDPTRILRAFRFSERFSFRLEDQTAELLGRALLEGRLDDVSPERVRDEILLCIQEDEPWPVLRRICEEGVFGVLYHPLFPPACFRSDEDIIKPALDWLSNYLPAGSLPERDLSYLALLMSESITEDAIGFTRLYHFDRSVQRLGEALPRFTEIRRILEKPPARASDLAWAFESIPEPFWVVLAAGRDDDDQVRINLRAFLTELRGMAPEVNGEDLIAEGFEPGPAFSQALAKIRRAKMDGEVRTRDEEMRLARQILRGE